VVVHRTSTFLKATLVTSVTSSVDSLEVKVAGLDNSVELTSKLRYTSVSETLSLGSLRLSHFQVMTPATRVADVVVRREVAS
jgi:hypothetical protein